MHPSETVDRALQLARGGASTSAIARETGVARATVRAWLAGRVPRGSADRSDPWVDPRFPAETYSHLLGLYLGDGCITQEPRTTLLARRVPTQCVVVSSRWKSWPAMFPQHGIGRKHERPIHLQSWQRAMTTAHPEAFVRGLLNSDGCRFVNRVRVRGKEYGYTTYEFSNRSEEIKALFCEHLDLLGIAWRRPNSRAIAISRREAVERLDAFVGAKR